MGFSYTNTICLYLKSSVLSNCIFAGPNSIPRTLLAKFSEHMVSVKSFSLGLICTNINVLESPPATNNFEYYYFLNAIKISILAKETINMLRADT